MGVGHWRSKEHSMQRRTTQSDDNRPSETRVSQRGTNQESDHNKHHEKGQSGHKPQEHSPAEEKD
jgi:hypothetical protein